MQSSPSAQLGWEIRGEPLGTKGPILEVFGVTEERTGPYTCQAFNDHTNRSSSVTKHIVVGEHLLKMNSVKFHHFIRLKFVFAEMSRSGQQAVGVWFLPMLLLSADLL